MTYCELPLQVFLLSFPQFSSQFPASLFPPSDPYIVRFLPRSDGGMVVEVGFSGDFWNIK